MDPRPENSLHAARAHLASRGDRAALPWLDRALERDPGFFPARSLHAAARERTGDLEGALQDYAELATGDYHLLFALRGVGRVEAALRAAR